MGEKVVSLSQFRASLARAYSREGKRLLASDALQDEVAKLQPLESYYIVKELGSDDAMPILRAMDASQLTTLVDLDCWQGDQLVCEDLDAWLAPFGRAGEMELAEAFDQLGDELQAVFIDGSVRVYDNEEDAELPEAPNSVARMVTDDTMFVIEKLQDDEREVDAFALIKALYKLDANETYRMLKSVIWESMTMLEEQAYQFRRARLDELGFAAPERALEIFKRPPQTAPGVFKRPVFDGVSNLPALYAQPFEEESLLNQALSSVGDETFLAALEEQLMTLVNHALIALGHRPKDIQSTIDVALVVRDTLSLGLEVLMRDQKVSAPIELLEAWPLRDIFSHAHWELKELYGRAKEFSQDPVAKVWLDKVENTGDDYSQDRRDRLFVRALFENYHPQVSGEEKIHAEKRRALKSLEDIDSVLERLDSVVARVLA